MKNNEVYCTYGYDYYYYYLHIKLYWDIITKQTYVIHILLDLNMYGNWKMRRNNRMKEVIKRERRDTKIVASRISCAC